MECINAYDIGETTSRLRLGKFVADIDSDDVRDYSYAAALVRNCFITEAWATLIAHYGTEIDPLPKRNQTRDATVLSSGQDNGLLVAAVTRTGRDIAVDVKVVQKSRFPRRTKVVEGATLYPDSLALKNTVYTAKGDVVPYKSSRAAQEQILRIGRKELVAAPNGRMETAEQVCHDLILREPQEAQQYINVLQDLSRRLLMACPVEVATDWDNRCLQLPHQELTGNPVDV
jgi:hypothetical protein